MDHWFEDIAELIAALNTQWFPQVLQGALQSVFQYDYFLLVLYEKDKSARIVRSDFQDTNINHALELFEKETYRADAMFRLFSAGKLSSGLFEMSELQQEANKLGRIGNHRLPHLETCDQEEMGFRTVGWPRSLQETCLVGCTTDTHCATISLYNTGLSGIQRQDTSQLQEVFPIIAAFVRAYFTAPISEKWYKQSSFHMDSGRYEEGTKVFDFFNVRYDVMLTPRETDIFERLLIGNTVSAIANELCISIHTAKTHRRNVYGKIGLGNQLELMNQYNRFLENEI